MDIPSIPSDNPFKFLFFAGVLIIFYTGTFRLKETKALEQETETLSWEIKKFEYQTNSIKQEADYLNFKINLESKEMDTTLAILKKSKKLSPQYVKYKDYLSKMQEAFEKKNDELTKRTIEKDIAGMEVNAKISVLNLRNSELDSFKTGSILLCIAGGLLILFGFYMWYKESRMVSKMLKLQYNKAVKDDLSSKNKAGSQTISDL